MRKSWYRGEVTALINAIMQSSGIWNYFVGGMLEESGAGIKEAQNI